MTDLTAAPTSFVPTGHPVRRFVVSLAVMAAAAAALWWSGLAAPRLTAESSSGQYDRATHLGTEQLLLRNQTPFPVEIRAAAIADDQVRVDAVRLDGTDVIADGAELGGGETATLEVDYVARCYPGEGRRIDPPLRLTVATAVGLERVRSVGDAGPLVRGACPRRG